MPVENVGGATVITGEHIQVARLLALKGRLKLEIVGLKSRGRSTSTILKQEFGWKGNKQNLLKQLEAHIAGLG